MWQQIETVFDATFDRIQATLANLLPGVLATILILVVAYVIAVVVRSILRRSLARVGFDRRARALGLTPGTDWGPGHAPSVLVARAVYWLVVLVGIALGLDVLGSSTTSALGLSLLAYLPRLVVGLLIFFVGVGAARFLERNVLIGAVNMQLQGARLISLGVKWIVLVFSTALSLNHLEIGGILVPIGFSILVGGIVLTVALAVGLGSRDAVRDSISRRMHPVERLPAEDQEEEDSIQHL